MSTLKPKPKPKHRPFCFSVKGHVKMLRLDIINSAIAAIFMIIISVLSLLPETTTFIVLGGVFGLLVAVCCIADGVLMYRKLLFNPSGPYQKRTIHDKI
ncbi:chemokine-like factor isoform X3 [Canis aureus]